MRFRQKVTVSFVTICCALILVSYPLLRHMGHCFAAQDSAAYHQTLLLFLGIEAGSFLVMGLLMWYIFQMTTRPIQEIIHAIRPYQQGEVSRLPTITLSQANNEFVGLAETLNSLSRRIEEQIAFLTHEKNEKSAILESLIEGVVAVDQQRTIIYLNRTAELFLEVQAEKVIGKPFSALSSPPCEELIQEAEEKGLPVVLVIPPERKQKRYLDAVAVPRGAGGAILVLQDKTSMHKFIELGRDFIANASHELKTPITIIRGFAETLHDHPELTREVYEEITQKIVKNCQRMDTLVKNLLILAAVDERLPRSRLQECLLQDLVEQAKQTILSIHPTVQITVTAKGNEPCRIMADSDLLFQAILNLLDNAVKYSKFPAQITVSLERIAADVVLRITDRGQGIPEEDIDRIFERFYSVDKSHSRSLGGSGLGLSIVERIIEKHCGKIEVRSKLGQGTTFIITLPVEESS